MPQVPTLQPNVRLQSGSARVVPPAMNIEAYRTGNAGAALAELGGVISAEAVARQKRINDAAVLETRNNLQLQAMEKMRELSQRLGKNAIHLDATEDQQEQKSVTEEFNEWWNTAYSESLGTLRNDAQRREFSAWGTNNFPIYAKAMASHEDRQSDSYFEQSCDTGISQNMEMATASLMGGDEDSAANYTLQARGSFDAKANWKGVPDSTREEEWQGLQFKMLANLVKRQEEAGLAIGADRIIDRYYNAKQINRNQYQLLKEGNEASVAEIQLNGIGELIKNNPAYWSPDGKTLNEEAVKQAFGQYYMDGETATGGQVGLFTGDNASWMYAIGGQESGYDWESVDYVARDGLAEAAGVDWNPHVGIFNMEVDFYNTWAKEAGIPEVSTPDDITKNREGQVKVFNAAADWVKRNGGGVGALGVLWYTGSKERTLDYIAGNTQGSYWTAPQSFGQPSILEYAHSVENRLGTQGDAVMDASGTARIINQRKQQAFNAMLKRISAEKRNRESIQNDQITENILQMVNQNPTATYSQIKNNVNALCDQYGVTSQQQRNSFLTSALTAAGLTERINDHDYKLAYNNVMEKIASGELRTFGDVMAAFPEMTNVDRQKVKKMFEPSMKKYNDTIKRAVSAAAKAAGYTSGGIATYYNYAYVQRQLEAWVAQNPDKDATFEIYKMAARGFETQPLLGEGGGQGWFGLGAGYVTYAPVCMVPEYTDNPNFIMYQTPGNQGGYFVDESSGEYYTLQSNGEIKDFVLHENPEEVKSMYPNAVRVTPYAQRIQTGG